MHLRAFRIKKVRVCLSSRLSHGMWYCDAAIR